MPLLDSACPEVRCGQPATNLVTPSGDDRCRDAGVPYRITSTPDARVEPAVSLRTIPEEDL